MKMQIQVIDEGCCPILVVDMEHDVGSSFGGVEVFSVDYGGPSALGDERIRFQASMVMKKKDK